MHPLCRDAHNPTPPLCPFAVVFVPNRVYASSPGQSGEACSPEALRRAGLGRRRQEKGSRDRRQAIGITRHTEYFPRPEDLRTWNVRTMAGAPPVWERRSPLLRRSRIFYAGSLASAARASDAIKVPSRLFGDRLPDS